MKSLRNVTLSVLLTLGAFGAVTYTACNKDECKDVTCLNGGTCSGGNCSCPIGYEGTRCETMSKTKFIGTYLGNETCTVGTDTYAITITDNSNDIQINVLNIYNQGFTAVAQITGVNSFSFSGSTGSTTYSGTGTISVNQLTLSYQITSTSASNACTFIGTK